MRRRNRPGCIGLKALALLLAAAIIFLAVLQHSTTTLTPRALVRSRSKPSDALPDVFDADDERREELKALREWAEKKEFQLWKKEGDLEYREERLLDQEEQLNKTRARAQAADAAASAAQAREQASNARAAAAERRAAQAEAALEAREQASHARGAKTQFLKCAHRAKAYGAAWLARTELLARQPAVSRCRGSTRSEWWRAGRKHRSCSG